MTRKQVVIFVIGAWLVIGVCLAIAIPVYYRSDVLVEGVIFDADDPMAVVNGTVFSIGSQVKGLEIIAITEDKVSFRDRSGRIITKRVIKKSGPLLKTATKSADAPPQKDYTHHYHEAIALYKEAVALSGGRFSRQGMDVSQGSTAAQGPDQSAFQEVTQDPPGQYPAMSADPNASLAAYEAALKKLQEALAGMDEDSLPQGTGQGIDIASLQRADVTSLPDMDPEAALEAYQKAMAQMQAAMQGLNSAAPGGYGPGSYTRPSADPGLCLRAYQKALYKAQTALGMVSDSGQMGELKKIVEECRFAIAELEEDVASEKVAEQMELADEYYSSGVSYLGADEKREAKEAFRQALSYCKRALTLAAGNDTETIRIQAFKKRVEAQLAKLKGFNL